MISVALTGPDVLHFSGDRLAPISAVTLMCGGIAGFCVRERLPALLGQPALVVVDPDEPASGLLQRAIRARDAPVDLEALARDLAERAPDLNPISFLVAPDQVRAEEALHDMRSRLFSKARADKRLCRSSRAASSPRYCIRTFASHATATSATARAWRAASHCSLVCSLQVAYFSWAPSY